MEDPQESNTYNGPPPMPARHSIFSHFSSATRFSFAPRHLSTNANPIPVTESSREQCLERQEEDEIKKLQASWLNRKVDNKPPKKSKGCRKIALFLIILVILLVAGLLFAFGGLDVILDAAGNTPNTTSSPTPAPIASTKAPTFSPTTLSPTRSPTRRPLIPNFPEEVREDRDYCGASRLKDGFDNNEFRFLLEDFLRAIRKWSAILKPSEQIYDRVVVPKGPIEECGVFLEEDLLLDHLMIILEFKDGDDVGKFVANSRPCFLSNFPALGIVSFDIKDALRAFEEGFFIKLAEREIAHVLGFGKLWKQSSQGDIGGVALGREPLIQRPVFDEKDNLINVDKVPFFIGEKALEAFRSLDGQQEFPPVEDGVLFGEEIFEKREDAIGVADVFWDFEVFKGELMVFQLSKDVSAALSIVTLASLEDLGYLVDREFAEEFRLNF